MAALRAWASCCFFPPFLSGSDPSVGWWNHGVTRQGWTADTAKHTVLLDRKSRAQAALSCPRVWGGSFPPSRHATRSASVAERQPETTAKTHPVERSSRGKKTTGVKLEFPPPLHVAGGASDTELWDRTAAATLNTFPAVGRGRGFPGILKVWESLTKERAGAGDP